MEVAAMLAATFSSGEASEARRGAWAGTDPWGSAKKSARVGLFGLSLRVLNMAPHYHVEPQPSMSIIKGIVLIRPNQGLDVDFQRNVGVRIHHAPKESLLRHVLNELHQGLA